MFYKNTTFTSCLRGLYVITDPALTPPDTLLRQVESALLGGARIVQYRDKSTDTGRRFAQAFSLRQLCLHYEATFIINDDVALAKACDADGVHLGLEDTSLEDARRQLGENRIIGATCHDSLQLAHRAIDSGADYVAFGRFFHSGTKPDAPPARLEDIAPFLSELAVPAVAIGGITLQKTPPLIDAGFAMTAVIGDIFSNTDIQGQCAAYKALFDAATRMV